MSSFTVKLKWNKEIFNLELNTLESPSVFKAQIFALTGVSNERQKVMFKGAVIKDDEWSPFIIKSVKNGVTFLMMGSNDDLPVEPKEKIVFVEDMTEKELATALDLPSGLINLGNTCYLNATIQCLHTVAEMRECLKNYNGSITLNDSFDGAHDIVVALRDVYNKMSTSKTVMPIFLLEMLHMMFPQFAEKTENGQFAQQDANECWGEIVKVLQQKLFIKLPDGSSESFLLHYFGGTFASTMKCDETEEEQSTTLTEPFLQLSCFISQEVKYLQTGLKLRLKEEVNKFSSILNRNARFTKTNQISRLPAYLAINLVRFFYKEKNSINAKILKDVKFSFSLDLFELCTPELQSKLLPMRQKFKEYEDSIVEKKSAEKIANETATVYDYWFENDIGSNNTGMYQLNAVLTHKGRSSSSGHYVAWIKHKEKWFKCDDDTVLLVTEEEVLKLSGGGDWHCAYVLLYGPQLVKKLEN